MSLLSTFIRAVTWGFGSALGRAFEKGFADLHPIIAALEVVWNERKFS